MVTLGVDLASAAERTAVCWIRWEQGSAEVLRIQCGADDDALLAAIMEADKVGIDVPFGWPDDFVRAISAYAETGRWPTSAIDRSKSNKPLYFRATDHFIRYHAGGKPRPWPLSVSSDLIAYPAMRAAALFTRLAELGQPVERDGSGKVVEVYPAAALRAWGFAATRYKGKENRDARCRLVDDLRQRTASWLRLSEDGRRSCESSDDVLDALIAALVARAAAVGQCEPIPDEATRARANREGWIALPLATALNALA